MPPYVAAVGYNTKTQIAVSGTPAYFWGSLAMDTQDTRARISSVACASNVATIVCTIYQGNIPIVGNFISVQGTVTASGAYNVTDATILSISGTPSTGVYTITYACTTANLTTTADSGQALIPVQEVAEALTNSQSVAIYVPSQEPVNLGARSITVATTFPSLPTAATVTLYTALHNSPVSPLTAGSEWTPMGVVAVVAGGVQTAGPLQTYQFPAGRFFCLVMTGVSGGSSPKVIAKMLS